MRAISARDLRGLMVCPWGCGQAVRKTINNNARRIYINPVPDQRGRIAAFDTGGGWRSRQLHKGEGPSPHERLYVIHNATCPARAALNGATPRPPRPVPVPPAPVPLPAQLGANTRAELQSIRERLRGTQRGRR